MKWLPYTPMILFSPAVGARCFEDHELDLMYTLTGSNTRCDIYERKVSVGGSRGSRGVFFYR